MVLGGGEEGLKKEPYLYKKAREEDIMLEYLLLLTFFIFLPLVSMWIWKFSVLKQYMPIFLLTTMGALLFAVPWDYLSLKEKVWQLHVEKTLPFLFLGLPLEEWLFYLSVTWLFSTTTILLYAKYGVEE